jgi:hypothetical protein
MAYGRSVCPRRRHVPAWGKWPSAREVPRAANDGAQDYTLRTAAAYKEGAAPERRWLITSSADNQQMVIDEVLDCV